MASKKKQKDMGLHEEGVATPAADHPAVCFVVLKPGKASEGQMEQSTRVTNEGPDMVGKHNMSMEAISTSGGLPAMKHPASSNPQADNLSSDSICKGIRVTLDNNSMWNEFFRCKTEMILTKQGSRMFPYCRFRISGLQPSKKYFLIMDIQPLDNCRYKWTGKGWQVAGKAECHVKSQPFEHPESPSTGQHWMQNPVSFYKLKLTNNISDQEANTILHAMHRYLPRLHVVQTDKAAKDIKLDGPNVVTFTFPQTEFMAVTAYQNSRFAQLKVGYNPFAKGLKEDGFSSWGLKLKINSGREASRNGGKITNEQHPVKKSLKVLLANHKPRSSKSVDSKTSAAGDDQKNATINEDKSCPKIPRESSCSSSHPVRKLFSELTREAHVSLQRYNLEQLGINNHTSYRAERTNTKATALKTSRQDTSRKDSISVKMHSDVSLGKNDETIVTNRKVKEDKHLLNSLNCKDSVRADCSDDSAAVAVPVLCQDSSVDSDQRGEPEPSSEMSVKQQKRPAPLPLPALALFLKQHSTKSKKAKSKLDCPPSVVPSESLSGSQCSSACPPSDHSRNVTHPLKDLTKSDNLATEAALQPFTTDPNRSRTESSAVAENPVTDPTVTYDTSVLPNSDHQFCTPGTSTSTLATSSASCILPPPLEIMLPLLKSPQTPNITESSTQPSDFPTMKTDSLLADPECSSFGFEPLSPASSPEPLPPLPASLALELESTTSEPTFKAIPPEEMHQSEDSAASVFKWHTVLREPYIDTSFVTFQPTPQDLPLVSVTPPLLRSQSTSHPEPQTLDPCKPTPDSASSLQENEQSLPFPVEFSPFALQLPLSPTFSSLDGEGLSPTPSIADLVHFFSTNDDLGMEVEFSNTEGVVVPCSPPSTLESNAHEPSQHVQLIQANKVCKRNKKSQRRKLARMGVAQKMDSSTYTRMQPNLEEVEEQLFISFTSKEALKLHIVDSQVAVPHPEATPEGHLQQSADAPENAETAESQQDRISASEKILLKNLKLMKHRQIIHPVLQEVGLKMNLLDSTLAIDLQYLGVCLPIPPPGVSVELPLSQGVSAAFVSRTGKTTDVTQIKGWREKFTPPEAPSTPSLAKPEAGPSSDLPKKNLSAFCSDMLDEYLESEGKLIDERAASFSQPVVEPVLYELPTRSTSYVRTLDSVLKKEAITFPTSDLISGFVPPSKRPKLSLRKKKTSNKGEEKTQKGPKQNKPRPECAPPPVPTLERNLVPKQAAVHTPAATPPSVHTAPVTEPPKSKKKHLKIQFAHTEPLTLSPQTPALKKKKKLKPKTSSQTLSPSRSTAPPPGISRDMAPLESDSELGTADQGDETCRKGSGLVMTRALLKQKDLEDGVVWEGRPRTSITEERATIALTSLFTLMGFVSENPTAPIRLMQRRAPPCLNDFCRLGCICSSLLHCSRISHCGRLRCIFGCSCLKQKVVLLKNLDGSDSSSSHQENNKKSRRKRRMKMAYILKEVDSVTQPTEQVRTLWKRDGRDSDPDPVYVPEPASLLRSSMSRENNSSCARVRGYSGMRKTQKQKEPAKHVKPKAVRLKSLKQRDLTLMEATTRPSSPPPVDEPIQPTPVSQPPSPPPEIPTKPSKRLIILAECKWESDANRNHILMKLCEAMAQNQLDNPFWIGKYLITPISQTVDENGTGHCIQYKIYISTPKVGWEKPALPQKPQQKRQIDMNPHRQETDTKQQQDHLRQMIKHQEPLEDRQQEGTEEEEPLEDQQQEGMEKEERLEDRQREVMEKEECLEDRQREGMQEEESLEDRQREGMEEEEPLDDWQQEVQEGDTEEKKNSTVHQEDDGKEGRREKMETKAKNKKQVSMALPLLTGVSPAGFLSANKKQPRGTDHVVQVNGKLYPLAKVQLGSMGALHPANRLAAYLTGRVGSSRKQQGTLCSSSSSSKPPQTQSSGLTLQTVSSASPGLATSTMTPCPSKPQSSATELMLKASSTVLQPAVKKVNQSAVGSSSQPTGETPEVEGTQFINLRVYPSPVRPGSQFRTVRAASAPKTDFEASSSMVQPGNSCPGSVAPKGSHMLLVPVQGPGATAPVSGLAPQVPGPPTTSQRTVLQSVQTASGVKYYRRQDGKLVQLVPVSQLQSANPHMPVERGPSFENSSSPSSRADRGGSVRSAAPPQTPVVTVVSQTLPLTTVTMTTSTPSLSGLRSFTVSPPTTPLCPDPGLLAQKGMCTIRIIPVKPSKEPVFIACPKLLPKSPTKILSSPGSFTPLQPQPCPPATPVNLISLRPSTGQRAKVGVKMLTVSPVPVGPGGVAVQQKPASSQVSTCTTQTPTETTHRPTTQALLPPPPSVSEVTPGPPADRGSPEPELACNLVDLDIVCVEDEAELITTVAQPMEVVDLGSSSETDNSSDFEDEPMTMSHNEQERERRRRLQQLFNHLRTELGLTHEKTSKVFTLNKAMQVIKKLKTTQRRLRKTRRKLRRRRDDYLSIIAPTAGESRRVVGRGLRVRTACKRADTDVMEVVDLLDNSSDENNVITKETSIITVTSEEEEVVPSVTMEMEVEDCLLAGLARVKSSESSLCVKQMIGGQSVTVAESAGNSPERLLLEQALQSDIERITCLDPVTDTSGEEPGKCEQSDLRKVQHLSSQQEMEKQEREASRMPAAPGGGVFEPPAGSLTDSDVIIASSDLQQSPQAPPIFTSATPTVSLIQQALGVLEGSNPVQDPPAVSHSAHVLRDKPRTIPNILSRSKNPAPLKSVLPKTVQGETLSFQALVPAEVLPLVGAALPGKPILTLSPLLAGPTVLQTTPTSGVASVTLNIPSLASQQVHLTSLPHTITATDLNNLLHLVQPVTTQLSPQEVQQQSQAPQLQQIQPQLKTAQQQVPAGQSLPPPPTLVSAGSDQSKDQDQPSSQSDLRPDSSQAEVELGGAACLERQETRRHGETERLTSLLNEILVLNQQTITTVMTAGALIPEKQSPELGEAQEQDHACGPWLLQLDSDSDDAISVEMEEVGLNEGTETTETGTPIGLANGNTIGAVLAPPPLLQMKMGGAKVVDPISSDGAEGGGRGDGGVAWRPMPRLVPLGLRGNPPS